MMACDISPVAMFCFDGLPNPNYCEMSFSDRELWAGRRASRRGHRAKAAPKLLVQRASQAWEGRRPFDDKLAGAGEDGCLL